MSNPKGHDTGMSDGTKAAIIGAIGVVLAALITGYCTYASKPSETNGAKGPSARYSPTVIPQSPTPNEPSSNNSINTGQSGSNAPPRAMYNAVAEVQQDKSYTDPETGFVFAVDEIAKGIIWGVVPGALSRYTLPDGTRSQRYRWPVGHRVDFQHQGRKFFMVIEDIDYDRKIAKIRIRETR